MVKGTEKVILIQEQLSKNRIIIDIDNKGEVGASVTSSTHERKSKTNIVVKHGKLYLRHNTFTDEIPIMVALKAMGCESDQEVVQMVGPDTAYASLLLPSLLECSALAIFTQQQALEYCGGKVRMATRMMYSRNKRSKVDEARDILAGVVLAHVPVPAYDFRQKCVYVAIMIRRILGGGAPRGACPWWTQRRLTIRTTTATRGSNSRVSSWRCCSRTASNGSTRT